MRRLAIVYFSRTDNTHHLALAAGDGAERADNVTAELHRIQGSEILDGRYVADRALKLIDNCDAVLFGSPTYMGGPAAQFKAFADASSDRWEALRWRDKLAAGFTCGSSPSGEQLATLQYFNTLAMQHGMWWLGMAIESGDTQGRDPLGSSTGAAACVRDGSAPKAADLATAAHLGERLAHACLQRIRH